MDGRRIKDGTRLTLDSAMLRQIFNHDSPYAIKKLLDMLLREQEKPNPDYVPPASVLDRWISEKPSTTVIIKLSLDTVVGEYTAETLLHIIENYCNANDKIIAGEIRNNKIKFYFDKKRF